MTEGRAPTSSAGVEKLRFRLLGPLRVWRGDVELDAGPRQQVYLLALLLAQPGRAVSKGELVDLIWGEEPPETALNVIHKYIGALRRLLEPTLPAREPGSYLLRRGDSYLCAAGAASLDLARFRELVEAARAELVVPRPGEALERYVAALELWCGSTGEGFDHESAGAALFAGVDNEFFDACTAAAELALACDEPERVLLPLHLAGTMAPLHEPVQASLVRALGAAGRRADALSLFRRVRGRLLDELGVAPGLVLEAAHEDVLTLEALSSGERMPANPPGAPTMSGFGRADVLVGRGEELAVLRAALQRTFDGPGELVLVEGEPGAGKSRLLAEIAAEAVRRGAVVAWGHCLDGAGTPSMWPWVQVVGALVARLGTEERMTWLDGEIRRLLEPLDGAVPRQVLSEQRGRFRLFERVVALVRELAGRRPVVILLDDLQWADGESLRLVDHLGTRLPDGSTILGALRDRAPRPGPDLVRTLAAVSRVASHRRLHLGRFDPAEVSELVLLETGSTPEPGTARSIQARTEGNPLLVRELSRMLGRGGDLSEDAAAHIAVPPSVRAAVHDRMHGLDDGARKLLRTAATAGSDVDLAQLARVTDLDVRRCLAVLDRAEALGLVEPVPGDPSRWRFTHGLERESVVEATSRRRVDRMQVRMAAALPGPFRGVGICPLPVQ